MLISISEFFGPTLKEDVYFYTSLRLVIRNCK